MLMHVDFHVSKKKNILTYYERFSCYNIKIAAFTKKKFFLDNVYLQIQYIQHQNLSAIPWLYFSTILIYIYL